jgi:putative SOS response-associated peptidase YedK
MLALLSFAELCAHNDSLGITSCSIDTAPAVPEIAHIHTRMPVIMDPASYDRWLSCEDQGDNVKALLLGSKMDSQLPFNWSAVRLTTAGTKAQAPRGSW